MSEQILGRQDYGIDAFGMKLTVYGLPQPGGSKRQVQPKGHARPIIIDDNPRASSWKEQCAQVEGIVMRGKEQFAGPLVLSMTFYLPRPAGHFGTRGLRASAPRRPTVRPDLTKLTRPLEDALTGIVWRDDAQVVDQHVRKFYGEPVRAEVVVRVLPTN